MTIGKINAISKTPFMVVINRAVNSQPFGTTFTVCDTKGASSGVFHACGGYGGFKIEGYKNNQWELIVSGNHKQSGVLNLNNYSKLKISVSNNTDDSNYNKLGLFVSVMIGSNILLPI